MIARYDLRHELCTFDFYFWLVIAKLKGATEIVFGTDGFRPSIWSTDVLRKRYESIIKPGPALLGLSCREGNGGERLGELKLKEYVEALRDRDLPRLKSIKPAGNARYTVTLRQQARKSPYRNSNVEAWREFASEIDALVIEDYDVEPMDLYDRLALYAGAEMNFGVSSGPMAVCELSPYPCMVFKYGEGIQRVVLEKSGLPFRSRMPWCDQNQFTFWEPDEFDVIMQRFDQWRTRRC